MSLPVETVIRNLTALGTLNPSRGNVSEVHMVFVHTATNIAFYGPKHAFLTPLEAIEGWARWNILSIKCLLLQVFNQTLPIHLNDVPIFYRSKVLPDLCKQVIMKCHVHSKWSPLGVVASINRKMSKILVCNNINRFQLKKNTRVIWTRPKNNQFPHLLSWSERQPNIFLAFISSIYRRGRRQRFSYPKSMQKFLETLQSHAPTL